MANKIIAVIDINNDYYQNIESLLMANILEKKYDKVTIMDLNPYNSKMSLINPDDAKEKAGISMLKVFDRSNYIYPSINALMSLKMFDLAKSLADKNDILLINPNQVKFDFNTSFYELATDIVVFGNIKQDINTNLVNFFVTHNLSNKRVHVYVYNYDNNIQDEKTYLSLIKRFKSNKVSIDTIKVSSIHDTIEKINNIDPWEDIYKKINGAF